MLPDECTRKSSDYMDLIAIKNGTRRANNFSTFNPKIKILLNIGVPGHLPQDFISTVRSTVDIFLSLRYFSL